MNNEYYINYIDDGDEDLPDPEILRWLKFTLDTSQYSVHDTGLYRANYVLRFYDPKAEFIYRLRWL